MGWENETLRFPENLDRAAIVARLAKLRESVRAKGIAELAAMLEDIEGLTPAQLGVRVLSVMNWLQDKPEHQAIATRVEMLAVNLKNLK